MKRTLLFNSLVFALTAAVVVASSQHNAFKGCPFNIHGLWRSDTSTEMTRMFFSFSAEGHVTLMGYTPGVLPQDFEMITSVNYKLDQPAAPKQIEFTTPRGNDVFPTGVTSWKIVRYDDDTFTTLDPVSGQQTNWVREQTHRYFLTFAARSGPHSQGGPAFAMWTVMDGRETKTEALGIQIKKDEAGTIVSTFGPIPAAIYDRIIEESEDDKKTSKQEESVLVRFELTEAEFETTHETYRIWENYVTSHKLPYPDPYVNVTEFVASAVEGLNQCGDKGKMNRPTRTERDEIVAKLTPPRQPLEYMRIMRKKNAELHVTNSMYPWVWRPLIQQPEH